MPETPFNISQVKLRTRRGAVMFGDIAYEPEGAFGPRFQREFQLVVMHQGVVDLRLDDRQIHVATGQAILLSPGHWERFQFTRDGATHHSWCAITPLAVPSELQTIFRSLSTPLAFGSRLSKLLEEGKLIVASELRDNVLQNGYSLALALALLCEFAREASTGNPDVLVGAVAMAKFENFIEREYSRPLTMTDLAVAAGVSKQHLMKLCRLRGKGTPMQLLYNQRLEAAADMLSHTGLSVSEIADRCGFANPYHFSRKFHAAYGESPREWRTRHWSDAKPKGNSRKP